MTERNRVGPIENLACPPADFDREKSTEVIATNVFIIVITAARTSPLLKDDIVDTVTREPPTIKTRGSHPMLHMLSTWHMTRKHTKWLPSSVDPRT